MSCQFRGDFTQIKFSKNTIIGFQFSPIIGCFVWKRWKHVTRLDPFSGKHTLAVLIHASSVAKESKGWQSRRGKKLGLFQNRTLLCSEHHTPAASSQQLLLQLPVDLTASALPLQQTLDTSLGPEPLPHPWRDIHVQDIHDLDTLNKGNPKAEGFGPTWFKAQHFESRLGEAAPDLPFQTCRWTLRHLTSELSSVPSRLFPLTKGTWLSKAVFKYLSKDIRYNQRPIKYKQPIATVTRILHRCLLPANMQSTWIFELKSENYHQILATVYSQISVMVWRPWLLLLCCMSSASDSERSLTLREHASSQGGYLATHHVGKNSNHCIFPLAQVCCFTF